MIIDGNSRQKSVIHTKNAHSTKKISYNTEKNKAEHLRYLRQDMTSIRRQK